VNVADIVSEVEAAGAAFRLDGEKVRVSYPDDERRRELAKQIALLRDHRTEVAAYLKARGAETPMPKGVRLLNWNLKEPPVGIESCAAVVIDPALFARTTLEQLRIALSQPKRWVGWTIPQLVDRLAQVGVHVVLEPKGGAYATKRPNPEDGHEIK
jgi:hypothetical protein